MIHETTETTHVARFTTRGGVQITRRRVAIVGEAAVDALIDRLDRRRGLLLSSGMDYPGRYSRYDFGFADPPLALIGRDRSFRLEALNRRGAVLLPVFAQRFAAEPDLRLATVTADLVVGDVPEGAASFDEERRSRRPSLFTVLRAGLNVLATDGDRHLGFYGAFGYDLAFQFEPIRRRLTRADDQRDLVLYLPDDLVVVDHRRDTAERIRYEFAVDGLATDGLARDGVDDPFDRQPDADAAPAGCDHAPGAYAAIVERARAKFASGDLFEAVPGQTFREPTTALPSQVFRRLRAANPAPFGALINLGEGEFLVSASPEMYVRASGRRIETCPISGTVARGRDPVGDADSILNLLNSAKEHAELTMCTDVDRNDKARVCEPGSVRVIGRRQIEMYSRVIHTVDHVEAVLRDGFDALDAFLAHAWAVTVTGAPKAWAMQFCEDVEASARRWYGGAIGAATVDGGLNTGLTIRTVRMKGGMAEVRAGATLLFDSVPAAEDAECALKASAMLAAVREAGRPVAVAPPRTTTATVGAGCRVLLVDHDDSFVHMLGDLFRRTGAEVRTLRHGRAGAVIDAGGHDLVVLSPGPGRPADFAVAQTVDRALAAGAAVFGVCLGLQGVAERFGGRLGRLSEPVHGKASVVSLKPGRLLHGMPELVTVGRYHSLYAVAESLPAELVVTGATDDGLVMALEHRSLPVAAVQFHPESVLSEGDDLGALMIQRVVAGLCPGPPLAWVA
jgi:anthranilate synthase